MENLDEHLPEEWHEVIFQEKIKPVIFKDIKTVSTSPVAIISGGQPGSGKSRMLDLIAQEFGELSATAVIIGDDLRGYHPYYESYIEQNDQTAALKTNPDVGLWVEKALTYAKSIPCHIILESTMRVSNTVKSTLQSLRAANYCTEAHILAVNERLSWQGVLQRYEHQRLDRGTGRMTPLGFHQTAYNGMMDTLQKIEQEKLVDKIIIYKRGAVILYENNLQNGQWQYEPLAYDTVIAERNRTWTQQEKIEYAENYNKLLSLVIRPERKATEQEIQTIETLRAQAYVELSLISA